MFFQVENSFKELSKFQGNLNNKENVLNFLKQEESSEELFAKLFTYSSMLSTKIKKIQATKFYVGKLWIYMENIFKPQVSPILK